MKWLERPLEGSEWRAKAACRGLPTSYFFPEDGEIASMIIRARQICNTCEVMNECREAAIQLAMESVVDFYGFWGGLNQDEIRKIAKGRRK